MKLKILFAFLLMCSSLSAQETITLKYFGLTIHPFGDPTAHLQPNKLDSKARFVANVGLFAGYEKFFFKDLFSVKIIQGAVSDCSNGFASITHLGARDENKKASGLLWNWPNLNCPKFLDSFWR
jgi:hypothetical protein